MNMPKFEEHCYNCKKYGHRVFECRSKSTWSSSKVRSHENSYIQDTTITIVKNMDTSLKIALEHISVVTTRDG